MNLRKPAGALAPILLCIACGCSPMSAAKWGVRLVGDAVNAADVQERQESLLGQPPRTADEMFGEHTDAWSDTNSERQWLIYPVEGDLLKKYRYVVAVADNRIVALRKVQKNASLKKDIPITLILKHKVEGKSPRECEQSLDYGRPLLTARNKTTGHLAQLYDAQKIKVDGITKPHLCLLKFDESDRCETVAMITVEASSRAGESGI